MHNSRMLSGANILPQEKPLAAPPTPPSGPPPEGGWPDKRAWAAVALDQALDTADDVWRHLRRQLAPLPTSTALGMLARKGDQPTRLETKKPVILVLGSGEQYNLYYSLYYSRGTAVWVWRAAVLVLLPSRPRAAGLWSTPGAPGAPAGRHRSAQRMSLVPREACSNPWHRPLRS